MPDTGPAAPSLDDLRAAAERLSPHALRTPLLRLDLRDRDREIWLKLENLQPTGSFKIRCMGNALLAADRGALARGTYTASSGNAGLGLAWTARKLGVPATVYAPASSPAAKLERIAELGARIELLADEAWWQVILEAGHGGDAGFYADAVRSPHAMAGNGTIGLEIVEQLPDVDTVVVPFGGGGLACGIASALAALKPDARLVVAESETAAPLTAAFRAGRPATCDVTPSFISGAGAPAVLAGMWPLVSKLVKDTVVVPLAAVEEAVALLSGRMRVVAEGAGAIPLAAALRRAQGRTVCVVTGGNIDPATFSNIVDRHRGAGSPSPAIC